MLLIHEQRIGEVEKTVQGTSEQVRQLSERINMGMAPTQQKILEKSTAIEILISELRNKFEISLVKMESDFKISVNNIQTSIQGDIKLITEDQEDLKNSMRQLKRIFVWGPLMLIVTLVVTSVWHSFFKKMESAKQEIQDGRKYKTK
jgi:hypothetical protein